MDKNAPHSLPSIGVTKFAQAMPEDYKNDDAIQAYRDYYMGEKRHIADWGKRGAPVWYC
jgi:hypothetical protein